MFVSAVIPAAGVGRRMGMGVNKQFLMLGDRPVIAHTLSAFDRCSLIDEIILVVGAGDVELSRSTLSRYGFDKVSRIVTGGRTRQESVYRGLLATSEGADVVVVHDGARPFVTEEMIARSAELAVVTGAAAVAVPAKDTIKVSDDGSFFSCTLDRTSLWVVQTPQAFRRETLVMAHSAALEHGFEGTDDASLAERCGVPVAVVHGSYQNLKITTPEDLVFANAILQASAGRRETIR